MSMDRGRESGEQMHTVAQMLEAVDCRYVAEWFERDLVERVKSQSPNTFVAIQVLVGIAYTLAITVERLKHERITEMENERAELASRRSKPEDK